MIDISHAYRTLNLHFAGLCAFDLVARHGNFTNAARSLGVSQSAISQRIKTLETDLDVALFTRVHRGVQLTNEGQRLLRNIQPAMEGIAGSVSSLIQRKTTQQVRLSLDFAFASFWMLPRLAALRDEMAEIDIQILTSQAPLDVAGDDCDLVIYMRPTDNIHADEAVLFHEQVVAVCSPAFESQHGPGFSNSDLLDQPLLSLSGPVAAPWHTWESWFAALSVEDQRTRRLTSFSNYDLVIQAALDGQGVALGWLGLVDRFLTEKRLVLATPDVVTSECGYVMTRNQRAAQKGPSRVFEWIVEQHRKNHS